MVHIGFFIWTFVSIGLIFIILKKGTHSSQLPWKFLGFIGVWLTYIIVATNSGVFNDFSFPPRIPIMIVLPLVIGTLIFINRSSFRSVLSQTPLHIPIYFQSFRIVVEISGQTH